MGDFSAASRILLLNLAVEKKKSSLLVYVDLGLADNLTAGISEFLNA